MVKNRQRKYILIFLTCFFVSVFVIQPFQFRKKEDGSSILETTKNSGEEKILKGAINLDWNETVVKSGEDGAKDIIVDPSGNVYITGKEYVVTQNAFDAVILKYNNLGNLEWKKNWGGNSDDMAVSIDIDSSNYPWIVGRTESRGAGSSDIFLARYNRSGDLEWNATYGGADYDAGYGIAIDGDDNVYVSGYTEISDAFGDVIILKYNSTGDLNWSKRWGGADTELAYNVALDSLGNPYLTGYTSSFGADTSDLFLLKFNSSGDLEWETIWGMSLPDDGYDLVVDSEDNIFIVGNTMNFGEGGNDVALLKFNSTGHLKWNITWGSVEHDHGYSIALDSNEEIHVVGYTNNFGSLQKKACAIKFNRTGGFLWQKIWGNGIEDIAYGVTIDNDDNLYVTGTSKNSESDIDIFLVKYLPLPDDFELTSDAKNPDPDGTFTLNWGESLGTINYSLYQSNQSITIINTNVTRLVQGNTNRTYSLANYDEGEYYFLVFAFNEHGNTSSNCVRIVVQYPPGAFELSANANYPDTDGTFTLAWTWSIRADNYSIYCHDNFIVEINNNGTLLADDLKNSSLLIQDLLNDDYYYIVVACNEAGNNASNCVHIVVRRAPDAFILRSNAGNPDNDGAFSLIWTKSNFTKKYVIYFSPNYISRINESVEVLYEFEPDLDLPDYGYEISGMENGTYYYRVKAINSYGYYLTSCIKVIVGIPEKIDDSTLSIDDIPWDLVVQILMYAGLVALIGVLIYVRMKTKNKL